MKRLFDIIASGCGLLVLSPVLLIVAICYYTWICNDRSAGGNSAYVMTYDMDWNAHPEFSVFNSDYLRGEIVPKPKNFVRMVEIAERLSKGFPELRIGL